MSKTCLRCNVPITGRLDKKFCSDYCRNSYNNKRNSEGRKIVRNINYRLRRNYRILEALNPTGKTKISHRKLLDKNFDFKYYTSTYTTKAQQTYYFVYNQGYLPLEKDQYLLIKQE